MKEAEPRSNPPDGLGGWIDEVSSRGKFNLTGNARQQLVTYCRMMREWNKFLNLTTVLDDEGMAVRHVLDSLMLLPWLDKLDDETETTALADIGSGAGLPGLVLKIARPHLKVMLLDSLGKRVKFLQAVISELELSGIEAVHSRAEDAARNPQMRDSYKIVTARAVAPLPVLAEYCLPFVRPEGIFIAMKGSLDTELAAGQRAVALLGGEIESEIKYELPGTDMQRTLLMISKIRQTPSLYPRKAGKPEKQPL